ncbi:MAG: molybdopterin dinucleotide binding domain-containing protein [Rhodospirillales bacterium]|jgi:trimethylamine-N-oxide reductase (cytochrome c)|nr:molybdopterin dinucleotide binding domain-containing protein [Rhodospirillales bacterium]
MHKVIDPLFEARNDYDIAADLADRLGYGTGFGRKDQLVNIQGFYDACATQAKKQKIDMPDFKTFWDSGDYFEFPVTEKAKKWTRHASYREDPNLEPLGTPSGKIEIFSKTIADFGYENVAGHAQWVEPVEWLGAKTAKEGALHLLSPHPKYRIHSQMNNSDARKTYTVKDREPIEISTADAKKRGIADGDVVRVFNDRGQTLAGAVVTDDLMAGVLRLHEGSWYDPDQPGKPGALDKYGSANQLTQDRPTSKIGQATTAGSVLVMVEKFTGTLPPVTAFDPPKNG